MNKTRVALSIEALESRIVELRSKAKSLVAEADRMAKEADTLEGFKAFALEHGAPIPEGDSGPHVESTSNDLRQRPVVFGRPTEPTADLVEQILNDFGPQLHVDEIIKYLIAGGWKGSGDEQRDYKNVFTNLSSKPKRFHNAGMAKFELVKEIEQKEQGR